MVRNARLHGRGHTQGLVDAAEVLEHVMQGDGVLGFYRFYSFLEKPLVSG